MDNAPLFNGTLTDIPMEIVARKVFETLLAEKVLIPESTITLKNKHVTLSGWLERSFLEILKSNYEKTTNDHDMVHRSLLLYCPQMSDVEMSTACTLVSMYMNIPRPVRSHTDEEKKEFMNEIKKTAKDYSMR